MNIHLSQNLYTSRFDVEMASNLWRPLRRVSSRYPLTAALVGQWVQGICCARAYMHVVSNQMRVRSYTEISYMQFNCRCTHVIVLQKHTFNGQLVAVFSSLIFAGSFKLFMIQSNREKIASFADDKIDCACYGGAFSCFYQSAFSHILNQINR